VIAMGEEAANNKEIPAKNISPNQEAKPKRVGRAAKKTSKGKKTEGTKPGKGKAGAVAFPKHTVLSCLRIPNGILDQNAGNECPDREAARFAKIGWTGDVGVEISSAIKYGLLERPSPGKVKPTELARKILRPQAANDRLDGIRQAVLNAPVISDFYKRYRGENLPEDQFLSNTAVDSFSVPRERVAEFINVFVASLKEAELLEEVAGGKWRVLDITETATSSPLLVTDQIKKLSKGLELNSTDTCFVMMPFAEPLGGYYASIYQPAIERAKLNAVRADAEIYGTGKIIDTKYGLEFITRGFLLRN
jgi:hypothetical protein